MKIRSKCPLRLGIAGGGTDVSPYCDVHNGAILNATINLYAYTFLETLDGEISIFEADDILKYDKVSVHSDITLDGPLVLHRAVYKRVMDQFNKGEYIPLKVTTYCDAPPGSGLGSSSAIVVSMLEAYRQLFSLPLGEYDLAKLAYDIERQDCSLAGGKQDQYAATFGGFNFMEFESGDRVIVNPLRIRRHIINELETSTILFYTGASRESAGIIQDQINSLKEGGGSLDAMHEIKRSAYALKEALLRGNIYAMGLGLKASWEAKKASSRSVSNQSIDHIENVVLDAGATSMKVSGAGGGGFIMIFVVPELKRKVIRSLEPLAGKVVDFNFTTGGVISWII
jgi:D-glycero-alpha-D-manno-heptose-7-phosphate kinase